MKYPETYATLAFLGLALIYYQAAKEREEIWQERLNEIESLTPVSDVDVSLHGCGWALGETINFTATHKECGESHRITLCRNRDGTQDLWINEN